MKPYKIELTNPCQENLNRMQSFDVGKFCNVCQTHVIDFTTMSDEEIIAFLKKNKTQCGSFKTSQLNRNLHSTNTSQPKFHYFFASILSLNFLGVSALANAKSNWQTDSISLQKDTIYIKPDSISNPTDSTKKMVTNVVPIISPFAITDILIKGDIVTAGGFGGYPHISFFDTLNYKNLFGTIVFCIPDSIRKLRLPQKIKIPFSENKSFRYSPKNKTLPDQNFSFFKEIQAILPKQIRFNNPKKWFEWW
ncbi:MAG: hypothetical protein RIQ33_2496 [Bacteroidota bacterium]